MSTRAGRRAGVPALALAGLLAGGCGSQTPTTPGGPGPDPTPEPTPSAPPNILFIMADDLDVHSTSSMSRLKSLVGDQGVTFTNAFATVPLCCPSRASVLTGQYAHNHGILINRNPAAFGREPNCFELFRDRGQEASTFATWLRAAGYYTGFVGKYLNRYPGDMPGANPTHIPPGWDEWFAQVSDNRFYRYEVNDNGRVVSFGNRPEEYITDVLSDRAVRFVRDAPGDRPFVLYLNPIAPHAPAIPPPRHEGLFPEQAAPRTPNFNEPDMSDKSSWFRGVPPLSEDDIERLDGQQRQRLRSLQSVDEMVEKLVQALEGAGRLANTFLIFTSDNGVLIGSHRLFMGKDVVYEGSIRIPLMVRGPGVPRGRQLDQFALNIDFAPTLAELARTAPPPDVVDGRSLAPLLGSRPPSSWRADFLVEHWIDNPRGGGIPTWFALRTRGQVYVEYPLTGELEFYDLPADPYQLENQAARAPTTALAPLQDRLNALRGCRAASCR